MTKWVMYARVRARYTLNVIGYYLYRGQLSEGTMGNLSFVNLEDLKTLRGLGWLDDSVECRSNIVVDPYSIVDLNATDNSLRELLDNKIPYVQVVGLEMVNRDVDASGIIREEPKEEPKVMWTVTAHVLYEDNAYYGVHIVNTADRRSRIISSSTAQKMVSEGILEVPSGASTIKRFVPRNFEEDTMYLFKPFPIKRPSWDESFMTKAVVASKRATCNRLSVGAVLVRGKRVVAEGYNGSRHGQPHCHDVGCLIHNNRCVRTIHAERNVIDMCARYGIPTEGASLYVTHYPCPDCMQAIANAGIIEVIYMHYYKHKFDNDFHEGMKIRQYDGPEIKI